MACMSIPGQSSEMRLEIRAAHAGYGAGVMDDTRGGGGGGHTEDGVLTIPWVISQLSMGSS